MADALAIWRDALGLPHVGDDVVEGQGVAVAFLDVGAGPDEAEAGPGPRIELLEPLSDDTPVGRHIARRGPGIHHVALRVPDVDEAMAALRAKGYRMTTDAAQPGAHGTRVVFVHPKSAGGVLVELVQRGGSSDGQAAPSEA